MSTYEYWKTETGSDTPLLILCLPIEALRAYWVRTHLLTEDFLPLPVLPVCEIVHEPVHAKSSIPQSSVPLQSDTLPPVRVKTNKQNRYYSSRETGHLHEPVQYCEGTQLASNVSQHFEGQETMKINS